MARSPSQPRKPGRARRFRRRNYPPGWDERGVASRRGFWTLRSFAPPAAAVARAANPAEEPASGAPRDAARSRPMYRERREVRLGEEPSSGETWPKQEITPQRSGFSARLRGPYLDDESHPREGVVGRGYIERQGGREGERGRKKESGAERAVAISKAERRY
ncbi:hypothetical protein KM043_001850 [Ampulex compressa]|nr:hypothetical protein KM043_001850 [Ampulex compressa]